MNKAKELKTTTALVKAILEDNKASRNSDSVLYLKVLTKVCKEKEIDIEKLTVPSLLLLGKKIGLPCFETVRRSRQKIQAENPELAGSKDVQAYRDANEVVFREFARSDA